MSIFSKWKFVEIIVRKKKLQKLEEIRNTGYFTSDNEHDGFETATHNTFGKQTWIFSASISRFPNVLWVTFSILSGLLSVITREIPCMYVV
jgi:hypothetical protein